MCYPCADVLVQPYSDISYPVKGEGYLGIFSTVFLVMQWQCQHDPPQLALCKPNYVELTNVMLLESQCSGWVADCPT